MERLTLLLELLAFPLGIVIAVGLAVVTCLWHVVSGESYRRDRK